MTVVARYKDFSEAYDLAYRSWGPWLHEADRDMRYYLGDQWNAQDRAYLNQQRRSVLTFNRCKRVVGLFTGIQRTNRLSLKVSPVEGSDENTANQFSAICQWQMDVNDGYQVMSDAFQMGALETGLNLVHLYPDYTLDPLNGDIQFKRLAFNDVLLDPGFRERNLRDLRYLLRRAWVGKNELQAQLGKHVKEVLTRTPGGYDGKFPHSMPTNDPSGDKLWKWDEMYERVTKRVRVLYHQPTGRVREWPGTKKQLDEFLRAPDHGQRGKNYGQSFVVLEQPRRSVELTIFVEGEQVYHGPDLLGLDEMPFVLVLGYWTPECSDHSLKLQGVIRALRDPQTEANKRRSKILDIIDSRLQTGWKAVAGVVVNEDSLYRSGQGEVVWHRPTPLVPNVNPLDLTKPIEPGQIPEGMFRLQEVLDKDLDEIAGVNSELFGTTDKDNIEVAGFLAKLRQYAGLTVVKELFDNYRTSKKQLGRLLIQAVQVNYDARKVQRILNEQPTREFYDRLFGRYDCTPEEGIYTDTQRQQFFNQLLLLKREQAPIPWRFILEHAPAERKADLLKAVDAGEKAQAQAAQVETAQAQATNRLLHAEAVSRLAKAQEDRADAALQRVKMAQEIATMPLDRFMKVFELGMALEAQGNQTAAAQQGGGGGPTAALPAPGGAA